MKPHHFLLTTLIVCSSAFLSAEDTVVLPDAKVNYFEDKSVEDNLESAKKLADKIRESQKIAKDEFEKREIEHENALENFEDGKVELDQAIAIEKETQEELEQIDDIIEEINKSLDKDQSTLKQANDELSDKEIIIEEQKILLGNASKEITAAKQDLREKTKDSSQAKRDLATAERNHEREEQRVANEKEKYIKLEHTLEKEANVVEAKIDVTEDKITDREKRLNRELKIAKKAAPIERISRESQVPIQDEYNRDIKDLNTELQEYISDKSEIQGEKEAVYAMLNQIKLEEENVEKVEEELLTQEEDVKALDETVRATQVNLNNTEENKKETLLGLEETQKDINKNKDEIEQIKDKIEETRLELGERQGEYVVAKDKHRIAEDNVNQEKEDLEETSQDLKKSKKNLVTSIERLEDIDENLDQQDRKIFKTMQSLAILKQDIKDSTIKLEDQNIEAKHTVADAEQSKNNIEAIEEKITEDRKDIAIVDTDLSENLDDIDELEEKIDTGIHNDSIEIARSVDNNESEMKIISQDVDKYKGETKEIANDMNVDLERLDIALDEHVKHLFNDAQYFTTEEKFEMLLKGESKQVYELSDEKPFTFRISARSHGENPVEYYRISLTESKNYWSRNTYSGLVIDCFPQSDDPSKYTGSLVRIYSGKKASVTKDELLHLSDTIASLIGLESLMIMNMPKRSFGMKKRVKGASQNSNILLSNTHNAWYERDSKYHLADGSALDSIVESPQFNQIKYLLNSTPEAYDAAKKVVSSFTVDDLRDSHSRLVEMDSPGLKRLTHKMEKWVDGLESFEGTLSLSEALIQVKETNKSLFKSITHDWFNRHENSTLDSLDVYALESGRSDQSLTTQAQVLAEIAILELHSSLDYPLIVNSAKHEGAEVMKRQNKRWFAVEKHLQGGKVSNSKLSRRHKAALDYRFGKRFMEMSGTDSPLGYKWIVEDEFKTHAEGTMADLTKTLNEQNSSNRLDKLFKLRMAIIVINNAVFFQKDVK